MKKYLTILCILMMLLAAGCAKQQKATPPTADTQDVKADDLEEDGKKIESSVVDFTDMPLYNTLASSTHEIYSSLDDYTESFNLQDYIIFKGIKKKDSTQFLSVGQGKINLNGFVSTADFAQKLCDIICSAKQ